MVHLLADDSRRQCAAHTVAAMPELQRAYAAETLRLFCTAHDVSSCVSSLPSVSGAIWRSALACPITANAKVGGAMQIRDGALRHSRNSADRCAGCRPATGIASLNVLPRNEAGRWLTSRATKAAIVASSTVKITRFAAGMPCSG